MIGRVAQRDDHARGSRAPKQPFERQRQVRAAFVPGEECSSVDDIKLTKWKLKLPVFGPLIHKICMSRFARTFAQLIRSGVPILEVLDIVGGASGNHVVEMSIKGVSDDVEKGDNLSVALSKKPIFPPMMLRMVAAGEATGKIDTMLEKMADFWDEEIEAMLDALTSLIEPMLIVFLGVIVGGIVIAMFLPIFKLNEVVSQSKS